MEDVYSGTWHTSFGGRVFQFDAFLSHNNGDGSGQLHDKLAAKGLRVWHDGNADMADRQVKQRVQSAINASRYIVVCVPEPFRDSEWVRAEYVPPLIQSRRQGIERVVVVTDGGPVPAELEVCRCFDWHAIEELSCFLRNGNRLTFDPMPPSGPRIPEGADRWAGAPRELFERIKAATDLSTLNHSQDKLLSNVCRGVLGGDPYLANLQIDDEDMSLVEIKDHLRALWTLESELRQAVIPVLRTFAWAAAQSPSADNRANSLRILAQLARPPLPDERSFSDMLRFLRHESDEDVLWEAFAWVQEVHSTTPLPDDLLHRIAILALRRDPTPPCLATLPEEIRARALALTRIGEGLSPLEHARLARGRVSFVYATVRKYWPKHPPTAEFPVAAYWIEALTDLREDCILRSNSMEIRSEILSIMAMVVDGAHEFPGWRLASDPTDAVDLVIAPLFGLSEFEDSKELANQLLSRLSALFEQADEASYLFQVSEYIKAWFRGVRGNELRLLLARESESMVRRRRAELKAIMELRASSLDQPLPKKMT